MGLGVRRGMWGGREGRTPSWAAATSTSLYIRKITAAAPPDATNGGAGSGKAGPRAGLSWLGLRLDQLLLPARLLRVTQGVGLTPCSTHTPPPAPFDTRILVSRILPPGTGFGGGSSPLPSEGVATP